MLQGAETIEVAADCGEVFEVLADLERYPEWQSFLQRVAVRERDAAGRAALVEAQADARVTSLRLVLRCEYEPPHRVTWRSEGGDVKALTGAYAVEEAAAGACRVTFRLEADPGRRLGLFLRGPVADRVRDGVLRGSLDGLRARLAG